MNNKMVSIIITTYKRAEYLERAIQSVLRQTYQNFELIVVDDNNEGTDARQNVVNIMKKYETNKKIIYLKHKKNKNGAVARNTGIRIAKGDYIAFLDDDDFWLKDRLKILVEKLEDNVQYNAAYTSLLIVQNNKIIKKIRAIKEGNLEYEFLKQHSCIGTGSNMFFRSSALKKINGFDESFIRHQDLEVMVRFFANNNLILPIEKISVIKIEDSRINVPDINKFINAREMFLNKFETNIEKYGDKSKEIYIENYFQLLKACIRANNKKEEKIIEDKLKKYTKISIKMKITIFVLKINEIVSIENIKYFIQRLQAYKGLDKMVVEELKSNQIIR